MLTGAKPGQPLQISRSGAVSQARLAAEAVRNGQFALVVVQNRDDLATMRGLITLFTPEMSVGTLDAKGTDNSPAWKQKWAVLPPFRRRMLGRAGWASVLCVLYSILYGQIKGLLLTADNLIIKLPPKRFFDGQTLNLRLNDDMSPELLLDQLIEWGFQRESMVSNHGDIARRGDILDIFPPGYERPVRVEFFGDTVDEMRSFDLNTQRSIEQLREITLIPTRPICFDQQSIKDMQSRWKNLFQHGVISEFAQASMLRAAEQGDAKLLPGCVYDDASMLLDWLPKDVLWFLPGRADFSDSLKQAETHWRAALIEDSDEIRLEQPEHLAILAADVIERGLDFARCLYFEPLLRGAGQDLQERVYHSFAELFGQTGNDRPWQQMVAGLRKWQSEKRQVVLAFISDRGRKKFLKLAEQDGILPNLRYDPDAKGLFVVVAPWRHGAELVWDNSLIISEELLQPHSEHGRRTAGDAFKGLDNYQDLSPGDMLVHRDYGIGRFGGLHRMDLGGVSNDYLLVEYADNAKLYLPVDRLSVIQRFKVADGPLPPLDRLGGLGWVSGKEKARKAIEKIAADLMEMYAWRKVAKGFSYSPIGEMYREFEASFGFEETPDQAKAILDVLDDMDKPIPMDRLVCGDVGFGKTEVALRAAFRAACDGRQVALLCPTTVLAEQHYQTFRSRLAGFPVNVGLLSRFVTKSRQQDVLKSVAKGQIDILIGTHRLLSQDVKIPNIGLLIMDEEQRFGVRHKEKLKQIKMNVDSLTLTATPIPRTLQLSMSGIRDLSIIETAPPERKPVATAIVNREKAHLNEIVGRELARQGQIFWVHNRVRGLEDVVKYVRELAPQARVGMAHGQMPEGKLEEAMHQFWHGEIDILVCTAIIESGLDFPQANTLIVDQAQMFGLGQLYQLRGRVGRSDRQAYAVFVVSDIDALEKTASERLRIILEMDYLGAGFQVAMEDLRLRGAGNILGEAQSGHMARVGLDLYLEMLEEAVNRLKGEGVPLRLETEMNLGIPAHIPEGYISDGRERLKFYKMLSSAPDSATRQGVEMEMRDRFGPLPQELETFMAVLDFKERANQLGVARADLHAERVRLAWSEKQQNVRVEAVVNLVTAHADRAKLFLPASLELRLDQKLALPARLNEARGLLSQLGSQ